MFIACSGEHYCPDGAECELCIRNAAVDVNYSQCIANIQHMTDSCRALARAPTTETPVVTLHDIDDTEEDSLVTDVRTIGSRTQTAERRLRVLGLVP